MNIKIMKMKFDSPPLQKCIYHLIKVNNVQFKKQARNEKDKWEKKDTKFVESMFLKTVQEKRLTQNLNWLKNRFSGKFTTQFV